MKNTLTIDDARSMIVSIDNECYRAINVCKLLERDDLAKTIANIEYIRTMLNGILTLMPKQAA